MALGYRLPNALTMRLHAFQTQACATISLRDSLFALICALSMFLGGCSNSLENAQREAENARSQLESGDFAAARTSVARALAYRDDQVDILLLDARIKFQMGDVRAAFDAYRTVLAFDPRNLEALSAVAQTGVSVNERDVARDAIKRALAIDPGQPVALLSQGILLIDEKRFDEAIDAAEQLLAAHPGDSRGIVLKARGLFLTGRTDESFDLLDGAIETFGNNQWISAALLENARASANVPLMLEQFALLVQANPESVDLALDQINTLYKSGDVDRARQNSATFIERFGGDAAKMSRLLDLWEEYDRTPLRPGDLQRLSTSPLAEARLAAARYYFLEDPSAADALIREAPDARFMGFIARLHVARGSSEGPDLARQILSKDKTNCDALSALSEWHLAKGDPKQAIVTSQLLATQCRDRRDGYVQLATAYTKLGRPAATERVYREGIDAHPQDPMLTEAFASWLLKRGREDAALSAVRRLSKVAPSRSSTWKVYGVVCQKIGDRTCAQTANSGLVRSESQYALDPLPGVRRSDHLFGRTWS